MDFSVVVSFFLSLSLACSLQQGQRDNNEIKFYYSWDFHCEFISFEFPFHSNTKSFRFLVKKLNKRIHCLFSLILDENPQ